MPPKLQARGVQPTFVIEGWAAPARLRERSGPLCVPPDRLLFAFAGIWTESKADQGHEVKTDPRPISASGPISGPWNRTTG
jgi:hypothetical protein